MPQSPAQWFSTTPMRSKRRSNQVTIRTSHVNDCLRARKSGSMAAKNLKILHQHSKRINRRLDGSYGLTRDGFIFAITHTFRDQPFHQLPTGGGLHVLANDFFDLIGREFDRKTTTIDQVVNNFGLFFRPEVAISESG